MMNDDKLPLAMRVDEITPQELDALVKASDTLLPTVERIRQKMQTTGVRIEPASSSVVRG